MFEIQTDNAHVLGRPVGPLGMNEYLLACRHTRRAVLIDCGDVPDVFARWAEERDWRIEAVWLTHGHFDHVMGVKPTTDQLQVPVHMHPGDREIYEAAPALARRYGLRVAAPGVEPIPFSDGDTLTVGELTFDVIHTPGHCPGLSVFHSAEEQLLFVGDLIFKGSVGRVDLPGSNPPDMQSSLARVSTLPGPTVIFPGHGELTRMERELRENPFLRRFRR